MKLLFFDVETNGLPLNYKASYTEVDNWPRVISLAWMLTDDAGTELAKHYSLIRPDGWQVPTEKFWIENGYTQERSMRDGEPIADSLTRFIDAKMRADVLVAHNLNFDHRIVWAEIIRSGREPRSGMHKICTMMSSTKHCNIIVNGRVKWPKLEELHQFLFNKNFDGAHDALADVIACKNSFFELLKRDVVKLPEVAA